jgi:hypothetical protein
MDNWSVDNLYTYFDREGALTARLRESVHGFHVSKSRYLGLSLCLLVAAGALWPRLLAGNERRFW